MIDKMAFRAILEVGGAGKSIPIHEMGRRLLEAAILRTHQKDSMTRYLTTREAAGLLRVSEAAVRLSLKRGKLTGKRIGKSWLIPADALTARLQTDTYSPLL